MNSSTDRPLKMGIIGLGMGGSELVPPMEQDPRIELVAAADIDDRPLRALQREHPGVRSYSSAEALCGDPDVMGVWIASPNHLHLAHTLTAAKAGKHVICFKPMGTTLRDAFRMVNAAEKYGVKLMIGGLHSFYGPFQSMRRLITSGRIGNVTAINSLAYTDWLLAPRVPDEVDTSLGGGVFYRQSPHQVETLRFLGGGMVRSVRGHIGQWSGARPCPGYHMAFFEFEDGATGTMVYNGYGYFMTSELVPWGGTTGLNRSVPESRAAVRKSLVEGSGQGQEEDRKQTVRMGPAGAQWMRDRRAIPTNRAPWVPGHLGMTIVTCERGDIRQSGFGLYVYDDDGNHEEPVEDMAREVGRVELDEFYSAVLQGKPLYHDGQWGLATMEAQMAILSSSRQRREVRLRHQVPLASGYDS